MDPSTIVIIGACVCIITCAFAASIALKSCAPALSSVTSEKPELGRKLVIIIILGEALAIYGLLISFVMITRITSIQTFDDAYPFLFAGLTMGGTAIAAGIGIAFCGPAMMTAVVSKPESFAINILGLILSEALAIYGLLMSFIIIG